MRKTKFRRYIYIAAAALLLLGGCSGAKKQEIALLDPVGVQLDTEKVRVRDIVVSDQYTASVRAVSERVYFRAGGRLKDIYVRTGQSVKKGDLLAELDTEDARRDIDDAEKALESLERSYEHANSQARFDIELENFRLDKMRLTPETSAADLRAEEIRAEMLSLDLRHAVERQDAELEWRRSLLDDKRARLGEASLAARTDGVITYVSAIMPGDAVPPFTDIVRLADGDPASLLVICDSAAGSPPYGDNKTTAVIGGREYELEYVQPTMKEMLSGASKNLKFKFADPASGAGEIGAFAAVTITRLERKSVLSVPVNALYNDAVMGAYVYVMEDGTKVLRQVRRGASNSSWAEITEGLSEGEEVFVH